MWSQAILYVLGATLLYANAHDVGVRGSLQSRQQLWPSHPVHPVLLAHGDPIAVQPRIWPNSTKPREQPESPQAQPQATDKVDGRTQSVFVVALTWLALIALTCVAGYVVRGKSWNAQRRAPYIAALVILWTILVFSTIFYTLSSHKWTWLECIYFCIVTVTTVGYGDYVPIASVLDKIMLLTFVWGNMFVLSIVLSIVVSAADEKIEGEKGKGMVFHSISVLGALLFGAILFCYLESWTFIEGLHFATVTMTTVGYGHLLPNHDKFTMLCACFYILITVPMTGCFVSKLSDVIDNALKAKKNRMSTRTQAGAYIAIIIGWLLFGASGYRLFNTHGWTWTECLYLAAVTMTTVGYGDFVPDRTVSDHILSIVFIWCSVVVIATVFSDLNGILINVVTQNMKRHKALLTQFGLLVGIMLIGIAVFDLLEGWGFLNGVVFTSVTCTTVGYGHFIPSSFAARLFAVPFILTGVPLVGTIVGNISKTYSDDIQKLISKAGVKNAN